MTKEIYHPLSNRYENGMEYRRCGKSGVVLPKISLGFWHNFGGVDSYENCEAIARHAFDHGVCHFDLANNYGPPYGSAEETFGHMMDKCFRSLRNELFISSKAGYDMWPGPYGNWGSRKYLISSLDQSLMRMHLDYVDLFYSHRFDPQTPIEETLQALVDIVRSGKALYAGISNWPADESRKAFAYLAERDVPCLIYQGKYNIIDRFHAEPGGVLEACAGNGVGFIAFSPLCQGILTDRYLHDIPADSRAGHGRLSRSELLTEESLAKVRRLNEMALRRGQTLAEMALTWVHSDPRVTSLIVGASSVRQLETNLKAVSAAALSPEELAEIAEIMK
ncbi:MAG: aldo/keto reductase [Bacteroidales bacterium]|nr:aldo/keto reductase [Bacteroidales bacterium]